jgi:hypothetical protein
MRKLLVLITLLSLGVHAETWVPYALDYENRSYEYEHTLITHHDNNGKVFVVWTRIQDEDITVAQQKVELHCPTNSIRIVQTVQNNKKQTNSIATKDDYAKWQSIMPDTTDMRLVKYICSHYI